MRIPFSKRIPFLLLTAIALTAAIVLILLWRGGAGAPAALRRQPAIVYLSPAGSTPELWLVTINGTEPQQLTHTNGAIYDFSVSKNGEWIIYSALNEAGGIDLWRVRRSGENARVLVECGRDRCIQPDWNRDNRRAAYTRQIVSAGADEPFSKVWLLDVTTRKTEPLPAVDTGGEQPLWSPVDNRIAIYDPDAAVIRVIDLEKSQAIELPSEAGLNGAWAPDGSALIYLDLQHTSVRTLMGLLLANFESGQTTPLPLQSIDLVEFSRPIFSPDGQSITVGARTLDTQGGKQILLIQIDTGEIVTVSDAAYLAAAYSWEPGGERLVYQRIQPVSSNARPEVVIWDRQTGETTVIAVDAALPQWAPLSP